MWMFFASPTISLDVCINGCRETVTRLSSAEPLLRKGVKIFVVVFSGRPGMQMSLQYAL